MEDMITIVEYTDTRSDAAFSTTGASRHVLHCIEPAAEPLKLFVGVYDGHDGARLSTYLQAHLHVAVLAALRALSDDELDDADAVQTALENAFVSTDAAYFDASSASRKTYSGSTALVVLVTTTDLVICCNVGDCRAVLFLDDHFVPLSLDQTDRKSVV